MLADRQALRLPNGTVVVARADPGAGWRLYTLREWAQQDGSTYSLDREGHVCYQGKLTRWMVGDLEPMPVLVPLPSDR